jgi:hypothetical protein
MHPAETSTLYGLEAGALRIAFATESIEASVGATGKRAIALAPCHREAPAPTTLAVLAFRESLGLLWEEGPYGESHGTRTDRLQRPAPRDAAIGQSRGQVVEEALSLVSLAIGCLLP